MAARPVSKPFAPTPAASAASVPTGLDPDGLYVVDLLHKVSVGRSLVLPGRAVRLRGDILAALLAAQPSAVAGYAVDAA